MKHSSKCIGRAGALALVPGLLVPLAPLDTQAFSLHVSDDAQIRVGRHVARNFGAARRLTVRANSGGILSYVKFDLGEIPTAMTGASVARAILRLPLVRVVRAGAIDVAPIEGPWSEDTVTGAAAPSTGAVFGRVIVDKANAGRSVSVNITTLVKGWVSGTIPNHGIALLPVDGARVDIHSKESRSAHPPMSVDLLLLGGPSVALAGHANMVIVAASGGNYSDPRDAVANIDDGDGWCGPPSETNRCLIRIMPGTYDLGDAREGSALTMTPFVSIEGSGQAVTTLTARGTDILRGYPATVRTAMHAELRNLTVESTGGATYANAVRGVGNHRLTEVTAIAGGATRSNRAIVNQNTGSHQPVLRDVTAIAMAENADAVGISNSCSGADIDGAVIHASGIGTGTTVGIGDASDPGPCHVTVQPHIANVRATADGGTRAIALGAHQSHATVRNAVLAARNGSFESTAVTIGSLTDMRIQGSRLEATGSPTTVGVDGTAGAISIDHSVVAAQSATVDVAGSTGAVLIGSTRLAGGPVAGSAPVTCAGVRDEANVFFANACP